MTNKDDVKIYEGKDFRVIWNPSLCEHVGNCIHGDPTIFDVTRRPWVNLNEATFEEVSKVIDCCPSGALSYERKKK